MNITKQIIKPCQYLFEYAVVQALFLIFRFIPFTTVSKFGDFLGRSVFHLIRIRRNITLDNLRHAFPEKSEKEIKAIALCTYGNFGRTFLQLLVMKNMNAADIRAHIDFSDCIEQYQQILAKGKGGLILTAHFGNWEMLCVSVGAYGFAGGAIVRTQKNRRIDALINEIRQSTGIEIIKINEAPKQILRLLRQNKLVGIAADQDFKAKGSVWVDFFGRPVLTAQGPAVFALKSGAPLFYSFIYHQPSGRLKARLLPVEIGPLTGNHEQDVLLVTRAHTSLLEAEIRNQPDHWLWMHRRWKSTERLQNREP